MGSVRSFAHIYFCVITDAKRESAQPLAFLPYTAFVKFASIHILACAPFRRGNMPEPGPDQHHRRVPIRKAANNPSSATNLFHNAFETVIRPQASPVLIRKVHIRQRLLHAVFYKTCDPFQFHGA